MFIFPGLNCSRSAVSPQFVAKCGASNRAADFSLCPVEPGAGLLIQNECRQGVQIVGIQLRERRHWDIPPLVGSIELMCKWGFASLFDVAEKASIVTHKWTAFH